MPDQLPEPLTPADCDLTDFKFMPVDCQRLRDSDLNAEQTPEENWAAFMLWLASWHQVPAASVPDSDDWLAQKAGYKARGRIDKAWDGVRPGALRGFVLCSDGRYYHPVVAEKAREAWLSKLKQRLDTEKARIKKHNERHGTQIPYPEFEAWLADGCPVGQPLPVTGDRPPSSPGSPDKKQSKGQGDRQGQGQREGQGQGQGNPSGSGAAGPRSTKKCPSTFAVTDDLRAWAAEAPRLLDAATVDAETEKFRDHTFRDAKSDWEGTWRNWMRRVVEVREETRAKAAGKRPGAGDAQLQAINDEAMRLISGTPQTEVIDV